MHPIDVLENVLAAQGKGGVRKPLHVVAARSLAGLIEFASVRRFWWAAHGEDLVQELNGQGATWDHLGDLAQGLVTPFRDERGEVHLVPPLLTGWSAGDPFQRFQERFKTALVGAGASSAFAFMVLGAFNEMASNAAEHAVAPVPPVASYELTGGRWSFSVTDVGCGLLRSLQKNPKYAALHDEASAIRLAAQDGVSSTGEQGRGFGFTHVFRALVDRMCAIRFRSVGAVASWSGPAPAAHQLSITVAPPRNGFHLEVGGVL